VPKNWANRVATVRTVSLTNSSAVPEATRFQIGAKSLIIGSPRTFAAILLSNFDRSVLECR